MRVDINRFMEKIQKWHDMSDEAERIVALRVCNGRICIAGDKKLDDIEISIASSPLYWSSNEVSAWSVDFRILLK